MRKFDFSRAGRRSAARNTVSTHLSPGSDPSPNDSVSFGQESTLVYDLRLNEASSDRFYAEVASFSSQTIGEIEARAARALDGYSRYVARVLREPPRTRAEYALELLTVGMALRLYGGLARKTPGWVIDISQELFWMRRRSPRLKPVIDSVRAGIFRLFARKRSAGHGGFENSDISPKSGLALLPRLIEWMHSTGEFEQEARRAGNWKSYLLDLPESQAEGWIGAALELFDWFRREADAALGGYTRGVIHFLTDVYPKRFLREDQLFCSREPVEYHLGMVAAEVMNDGLRDEFQSRKKKVLLVPACLRVHGEGCKAVVRDLEIRCAGCDPACAIHRITRSMRGYGVRVFIVPHTSGFSRWLEHWQNDPKVGVAAVACMMNILPGGYEMRARRIASQCVPLDFPGCEKHWGEPGIPTSVNENRLIQIVVGQRRA